MCVCLFLKRSFILIIVISDVRIIHFVILVVETIRSIYLILWSRNYILIPQSINHIIPFLLCHNYSRRGHAMVLWSRQFVKIPYYNLSSVGTLIHAPRTIFYSYDLGRIRNYFPFARGILIRAPQTIIWCHYDLGYVIIPEVIISFLFPTMVFCDLLRSLRWPIIDITNTSFSFVLLSQHHQHLPFFRVVLQ